MASSNRHWPSMFKKSKTSTNPHGINSSLMSTGFQRNPYTSAAGSDERSPEPKPRWNPKPEQIRILEAIFNSGMVNPPRDEIRKIRTQLQEYGQVGDANVFYWFQNRKSRSKHKLRHLQKNKNTDQAQQNPSSSLPQITPPSSSSSSSDKSSPQEIILPYKLGFFSDVNNGVPNSNSPTASVNQAYFQTPNETTFQLPPPPAEPFSFPMQHNGVMTTQGFYLSEFSNMIPHQPQQNVVLPSLPCTTSILLSEIMSYGTTSNKEENQDKAIINNIMHHQHLDPQLSFCLTDPTDPLPPPITNTPPVTVPSPVTELQGVGEEDGTAKCTVFINDVVFEVPVGPFNVREAFGEGAVLFHSSGHPVLTDEWSVTLQSLQHGASYYYLI